MESHGADLVRATDSDKSDHSPLTDVSNANAPLEFSARVSVSTG